MIRAYARIRIMYPGGLAPARWIAAATTSPRNDGVKFQIVIARERVLRPWQSSGDYVARNDVGVCYRDARNNGGGTTPVGEQ
jgi:hypothetical protein